MMRRWRRSSAAWSRRTGRCASPSSGRAPVPPPPRTATTTSWWSCRTTRPHHSGGAPGRTTRSGDSQSGRTYSSGPSRPSASACICAPRPPRPSRAKGDSSIPPDPIRAADTRAWLARALDDLRCADIDLAATPPLLGDTTFHCQQAVEKALKAFLTWHDRPFRKTHDLVELGGQCVAIDASLEPLLQPAAPLTEYAWRYRYPG